ncbi:hypothetical protein D3227_35050 [Mesorhizobium waimense]|uniref:Uncharacterized protein n=1 Tax=Mesorhizobium waimense TaxID=1300307 RepID=A0A3A5K146_9HYPH|nr:hypothetical protein [Mesorhizobium waimense]RJT28115.1 hypothetical protein D3227_35050 [Mesorhizobium waimense]
MSDMIEATLSSRDTEIAAAEQKMKRLGRELAAALDEFLRASNSVGYPVCLSVYPRSLGRNKWLEEPTLN